MGPNETERATKFPNITRSVFYCPHDPHLVWDLHDTTSYWVLAAVASIISPLAVLLNTLIIIAVKQRKELQRASNILLSSLAVTDVLVGSLSIPLSAVVELLVTHQVQADHSICVLDFVLHAKYSWRYVARNLSSLSSTFGDACSGRIFVSKFCS